MALLAVCTTTPIYEDNVNSKIGVGTTVPSSLLSVGANSQFQVYGNGDES